MAALQQHSNTVPDLEIGDLVEFKRTYYYSHWAVYIGEGKVIHLTGDENDGLKANVNSGHLFTISGRTYKKAFVKVDDLRDVVCGSTVCKNNAKDNKMSPDKAEEIIKRAKDKIGEIEYNVLWSNCEHFASYCRYGIPKSDQAESVLGLIKGSAFALFGFVAIALGDALKKRKTTA